MGNIKSHKLTTKSQLLMWRRSPRMDSNSTLVPDPHSSSWKREYCCSDHCIAYPAFPRPRLRIDSRIAALPEHEKEQRPVSSSLQEGDLFYDSLVVSGAKSRPRNPWAAVGSVTLLSLLLLSLVVIPLFHTDTLPKREILTMLYVPPAAAASSVTRLPVPTSTSRNTPTNMRIPIAVPTTQEASPSPPVDLAGRAALGSACVLVPWTPPRSRFYTLS